MDKRRFTNRCFLYVQKTVTILLVFSFAFTDLASFLFHTPLNVVPITHAATGDFATFAEVTGNQTIDSTGVPFDVTWDTPIDTNSNITLQGNSSDIDLADGGKYLVMYNSWAYEGSSGSNRRSVNSYLSLAGTPLAYGRGAGYIRDSEGISTAYARGSAIINAVAGDDLQVHVQRDDGQTAVASEIQPGVNGVSVLKLPDGADYLRARLAATSSAINSNTTFTDVIWDTADEVDTDSFSFTPSSGNITLKGDDGDYFIVTANVGLFVSAGGTTRQNYEMILTLDGAEIPGTAVTSYIRGTNDHWYGQLVYTGLVAKDAAGDQTLNVEVRRESTSGATTVIMGDKSAISIVAIPDTSSVIRLVDNSDTQTISNTPQSLTFDTQEEVSSLAFSHSTTSASDRIQIDQAGDYLFFANAYSTTTISSNNNREPFRVDWRVTGASQSYGSFGAFNRSNSTGSGGSSGAFLVGGLGTDDYVSMVHYDESSNAPDSSPHFIAGRVAVQGIALDENFYGLDTLVSASSSHIANVEIPTTDFYTGGQFVIQENSGTRNVTNITITESGSVDASIGLDNIELWYEYSTSTPYDCSEDSFDGNEFQFGSTDTNGFSGADGSSSFNDSKTITPSQSLCLYPVLDVTSSAADGQTLALSINNPLTDVVVTGGASIGPALPQSIGNSTTLQNSELTQIHYNWRNDDGSEAAATSVDGTEDTPAIGFANGTVRRLRIEVSNEGSIDSGGSTSILDAFSTGNTKTISPGSERLLIVGLHSEDSLTRVDVNTVTYGGQTLTEIRDHQVGGGASNGMWVGYLDESGIQNAVGTSLSASWIGGTPDGAQLFSSVVYENVNQTNPVTGWSSNDASSASSVQSTSTIPVSAGGSSLYFTVSGSSGQTHSEPSGYIEGTEQDSLGTVAANAHNAIAVDGVEQPTATWTGTNNRLIVVAFGINPSNNLTAPQEYRLEYAQKITTCSDVGSWIDVGTGGGGDWDVVDTANLTDGNDTTNIALESNGGVTDEASFFLSPNAGQKDISSQTGGMILAQDTFTEIEFAIEPTVTAGEGNTYCFRVSDAGTEIRNYSAYPEGSITADISVSASSSQVASLNVGGTNQYVGGTFVVTRAGTVRTLTDITITETGTTDASSTLSNPTLYYDLDTSAPLDCTGESYSGGELSVSGTNFSGPNGTSTFNFPVGIPVSSSQSFCGYVVFDVDSNAPNGDTVTIEILDPSSDVVVTGSTVGPSSSVSPTGSTTLAGPILTQTHFHWRNDNGDETDTGATSATGGIEDTLLLDVPKESVQRLRIQVSNEGTVSSQPIQYRLEYGTNITTCNDISAWTDVGAVGGAWDMATSTFISNGNTTDVDNAANGAMTEENTTFVGTGGLREDTSESGAITLTSTQFTELEYSIQATADSGYETDYCFRVTNLGIEINAYDVYPELITREKQDFFIQRGTETVTGTGTILIAGVDYTAPSATSSAFVRITNTQLMGAGNDSGSNGQNTDDVTAYISDQSDITNSFTIARPSTAISNTRVSWEIVEFVGLPGTDNEIIVRDVGEVPFATTEFTNASPAVSSISDDSDVVVFISGQKNNGSGTNRQYNDGVFTAAWNATTSQAEFERGDADQSADVSYATVEFTGANWKIQRVEHTYTTSTSTESETITAVSDPTRAFIHAQKRVGEGLTGIDELGHTVWISSLGSVSFALRDTAETPSGHVSVAWVIENTQTGTGELVSYQSSGSIIGGGPEPLSNIIPIGGTVNVNNASIFGSNTAQGTGTTFPRVQAALTIASSTHYELWQSDTNNDIEYRVEVVKWPVSETAVRQNYYRFYVDNDTLTPTDAWPVGVADLGENESLTSSDDPFGEGERIRIRMSLIVSNATLPESTVAFKLQYGLRDTSCSAITVWNDIGDPGDGTIWRGYNATPSDGDTVPSTLISVSDIFGSYEEQNNTVANPGSVDIGEEIEYDWLIEHNGAAQKSDYCFRMIYSDDTLLAGYNNYPTLRTTGYTPVVGNWRFYDDETNETPSAALASENISPSDIANDNIVKLRFAATEVEGAPGANLKFALQYSEYADFSDGGTFLTSTTSCTANSLWCYADGAGIDNQTISTTTLSDVDACVLGVGNGCGTHNEIATTTSSLAQPSLSSMEMEFTLRHAGARTNAVYYFRPYDITNDDPLVASSSFPSLVTEGANLSFSVSGLPSGTPTEGVTTDISSTPSNIGFSSLPVDAEYEAAHRLTVDTNATQGYQMFVYADQGLINSYATPIDVVTGTNAVPSGWGTGCLTTADGCFGYHAGDDSLQGGSARFGADDSYAALTTIPQEIMYSSIPTNESHDIVYKIQVTENQPAGDYETNISYIAVPVF